MHVKAAFPLVMEDRHVIRPEMVAQDPQKIAWKRF